MRLYVYYSLLILIFVWYHRYQFSYIFAIYLNGIIPKVLFLIILRILLCYYQFICHIFFVNFSGSEKCMKKYIKIINIENIDTLYDEKKKRIKNV